MPELIDDMRDIFSQVQFSKRNHPQCLAKLKKIYEKTDERLFVKSYIDCLAPAFSYADKHPKIENTLDFGAKFATSIYSCTNGKNTEEENENEDNEEEEEELCLFWNELFDFLLSNHDVADTAIRFRLCFFLNMLLNSMGDNAFIDDNICDRIISTMMERLLDKVPKIRAQAVFALHRLQDPTDENCPIIKSFVFHLSKDPQAEVRRAVLLTLGKNKQTLAAVLRRTRDINDGVRKLAYQFLTKITVRSLKIEQREQLLSDGLRDRSEKVNKYVRTHLLPVWLDNYDGEFIKLLRALDAEKALDTAILMLGILFKDTPLRKIIEQVPVDQDTKLIPFDKLSSESVIYWRCSVEHLQKEGCQEEIDNVLTDLSKFCQYIKEFLKYMNQGIKEHWEMATLKFILLQLFEITKIFDLSDEVGRENLKELIIDVLKSDNENENLIDCVVRQLDNVVPDINTRLNLIAGVIDEIRMPATQETVPMSEAEKHERDMKRAKCRVELLQAQEEQYDAVQGKDFMKADQLNKKIEGLKEIINELSTEPIIEDLQEDLIPKDDEETILKCLQIIFSMMQRVRTLYPVLRSLFQEMVLPSLEHNSTRVIILAIKVTTVFCILDENLAKTKLPIFFIQFSIENNDIWLVSLKGLFDLLVYHGFQRLDITLNSENEESDQPINKSKRPKAVRLFNNSGIDDIPSGTMQLSADNSRKNIIHILTSLLDNVNQDLRTIAVEGLCKLLLHRRISSSPLLSRLIILWHNPVTNDDVYLRQCLSYFFNNFPTVVPDSQEMIEGAFLPTLKILAKAPATSPLNDIDPVKVAQLILYLTRNGVKNSLVSYYPHNNLALAIIAEALNEDSIIDPRVLIRSLRFLNVNLEIESMKNCLQEAVEKLLAEVDNTDKRSINAIKHFKNILYGDIPLTIDNDDEPNMEEDLMIEDDSEEPDNDLPC